jgi:hypothetical protein
MQRDDAQPHGLAQRQEFVQVGVVCDLPEIIIFGEVVDESHLHGVLALVRLLDLHLISMHEVPD